MGIKKNEIQKWLPHLELIIKKEEKKPAPVFSNIRCFSNIIGSEND